MKLQLTDIELSILSDLVYAGNFVINSLRRPDEVIYPYQEMAERISHLQQNASGAKRSESKDFDEFQYMRIADSIESFSEQKAWDFLAKFLTDREVGEDSKEWSDIYELNLERLKKEGLTAVLQLSNAEK